VRTDVRPVRALLVDGTVVRLRELHEADAPLVAAFYRQLPVYDRFLRFFSAGALPAEEDLTFPRGPGDVSLGAFRGKTLVGVAQCVATGDPSTAEVALAVAQAEQAHGVGTLLLEHVVSRARRAGVRRFVADVLAENGRVRQVLADIGLPLLRRVDDGQVHVGCRATGRSTSCLSPPTWQCCACLRRRCPGWPSSAGAAGCGRCL